MGMQQPSRDYEVDDDEGNGSQAAYVSIQGWRVNQEDAHTAQCSIPEHPDLSFYAVYDGHGGAQASYMAATLVVKTFSEILPAGKTDEASVEAALKKALMESDVKMSQANTRGGLMHCGCTAIVCVVTKTHIVCGNLGDSRAILITLTSDSESGEAHVGVEALSTDQKPNNQVETDRIVAAGGHVANCAGIYRVNGDLAVARALGDFSFKNPALEQTKQAVSCEPEISVTARVPTEPQLLCLACDGIWDVQENDSVGYFALQELQKHREIYTMGARLIDHCLELDSRDNMSVLLVDLNKRFDLGKPPVYVAPPPPGAEGAADGGGDAAANPAADAAAAAAVADAAGGADGDADANADADASDGKGSAPNESANESAAPDDGKPSASPTAAAAAAAAADGDDAAVAAAAAPTEEAE